MIRGVNRHEHSAEHGKVITREESLRDVLLLKENNVNAVRTSHYPSDSSFYELCDEYGLLVMDETNIENHHYYSDIPNDPRYMSAYMERGSRMLLRDRNHPCIFSWSLGNESGYGPNHDAMAAWMRSTDPSRIIHYEGAITLFERWEQGHAATDLVCPMYPSLGMLIKHSEQSNDPRPFIMCEFSHAMGNSCGGLADYMDTCWNYHGLQGGFIWEMLDHGINKVHQHNDGREEAYFGYGGDFGKPSADVNFCCDGLFMADRTPSPQVAEMKAAFAPLDIRWQSTVEYQIRIHNRHDATDLKNVRIGWELQVDGRRVQSGTLPRLSAEPGAYSEALIPIDTQKLNPQHVATVIFTATYRKPLHRTARKF